jgi:2-hydroxychromene-2-carboxylate isomerase
MAKLDIYWSFRSPYSYLAVDRLVAIARDFDIDIDFRPVRPLAMREPDFFERGRKQFLPYLFRDVPREAEQLGIAFGMPNPDPIKMDMGSGKVDAAQPILNAIMGLALGACADNRGLDFAQAVGRTIWGGKQNWNAPDVLGQTLSDAGLDLAALSQWAADNASAITETTERNEAAQLEHHWGVPLMVLDGEPFFGQDRLSSLVWRLEQRGLRRD